MNRSSVFSSRYHSMRNPWFSYPNDDWQSFYYVQIFISHRWCTMIDWHLSLSFPHFPHQCDIQAVYCSLKVVGGLYAWWWNSLSAAWCLLMWWGKSGKVPIWASRPNSYNLIGSTNYMHCNCDISSGEDCVLPQMIGGLFQIPRLIKRRSSKECHSIRDIIYCFKASCYIANRG